MQRLFTYFVVLLHLVAGIVPLAAHHHDLSGASSQERAITAHTCEGHERHIPLETLTPCATCLQAAQRFAPSPDLFTTTPVSRVVLAVLQPVSEPTRTPALLSADTRGPPSA